MKEAYIVFCDNVSAIKLSKNYVLQGRSKHINVIFPFLHDLYKDAVINVIYCKSEEHIVCITTKSFKTIMFEKFQNMMGCIQERKLR